jgi:AcrR family transcriptional regulator
MGRLKPIFTSLGALMSIVVEHEKRRAEILEQALDVFVTEGFADTTYAKIAARCGITRTTLYTYFRNKQEIFLYSIKQILETVETDLVAIENDHTLGAREKLRCCLNIVIRHLEENTRLLSVLLDYLLLIGKTGADVNNRVRRRTIRLNHILSSIIIDGQQSGELKTTNVRALCDLFYGLFEQAIFKLTIIKKPVVDLDNVINLIIDQITPAGNV